MNRLIIFFVGAASAVISEIFWTGESRANMALWGGIGMLILRRIVLRFPMESRSLLCIFGALQLVALRLALLILQSLGERRARAAMRDQLTQEVPSFTYALYRFLLIAPAYTVIEYLESTLRA